MLGGGALAATFSYNKIAYAVYFTLEHLWEVERGVHGDVMMTSLVEKKCEQPLLDAVSKVVLPEGSISLFTPLPRRWTPRS